MVRRVDDIESLVLSLCDARMRGGGFEKRREFRGGWGLAKVKAKMNSQISMVYAACIYLFIHVGRWDTNGEY